MNYFKLYNVKDENHDKSQEALREAIWKWATWKSLKPLGLVAVSSEQHGAG